MFAIGRYMSGALWCFVLLMSGLICAGSAHAERNLDTASYHRAVEYCRGDVARPMALSPDRSILCLDGLIADLDKSYEAALEEGGLFVVRSLDGVGATALALANVLLQRRATVVIHDYCLSACANYFFFASVRTYVLKGALVAWRDGGSGFADCLTLKRLRPYGPEKMIRAPCDPLPEGLQNNYDRYLLARQQFYSERSDGAHAAFPPTSRYVARVLKSMYGDSGTFPKVSWTLNPTYLYMFKTKIHYEAYPASQDEVDEMAARLGLKKVIYDP
jgi:hypothetical protein